MSTTPSTGRTIGGLAVGLSLLLSVMLLCFGLPAINSEPRDVPLAIVGDEATVGALESTLDAAQGGAFDVMAVTDAAAAEQSIRDREVYGALIPGSDGLTVDVASAASPTVAAALTAMGQAVAAQAGVEVTVNDVVPTSEDDPKGVGLSAGALPIALGGFMAGVATTLVIRGTRQRLVTMATFGVVAGLAMTAILEFAFGTLTGNFWASAAAATLGIVATGMTVLGLESLLGKPGIAIGAVLVVLLGNPLSGLTSAPELLPRPWGTIGQLLPPGATGTLLRNVAFFDGAAIAQPLMVLCSWLAIGVVLLWLSAWLSARRLAASTVDATGASVA
ncbi:ABC transporter permease [Demequina litorisediminis]|uniref:Membrane protein n=1 Tax=Demequina litorisediminis TaxID=1849022 RepID=A0ABQ6IAJ3_9MICO|nr:ABC transporter permease [Demequina litorisediminis]GMA34078.1 membrane protein [Demequina litorisediminis]